MSVYFVEVFYCSSHKVIGFYHITYNIFLIMVEEEDVDTAEKQIRVDYKIESVIG